MVNAPPNSQTKPLTIVNRHLLRVTKDEWASPEKHFKHLRGEALDALLAALPIHSTPSQATGRRALLLFEYLLRAINEPSISSPIAFSTTRFQTLQILFLGALGSDRFIDIAETSRMYLAYAFYTNLCALNNRYSVLLPPHRQKAVGPIPGSFIEAFEHLDIDTEQVRQLRPYFLHAKSGLQYRVSLGDLRPILGERFTERFYEGLRTIARPKAKDSALRDFGTTFTRFVCARASRNQPVSSELLNDPYFVQIFLVDFMEYHFMKMTRRREPVQEGTLSSLQKLWSRYLNYWASLARQGIVAGPRSAYPAGNPKLLSGTAIGHRKIKAHADGNTTILTEKLITPVPLHITDEEATKLIFQKLTTDFKLVQTWLRDHLHLFFRDYDDGCKLAGTVQCLPDDANITLITARSRGNTHGLAIAIRYFKDAHGGYADTSRLHTPVYPKLAARGSVSKTTLSRHLGIPGRREAMAFMAFLVSIDGRFSESALATARMFDGSGKRINAVDTDAGITLTVLKERDARDGWHHVNLTGEALHTVRRWIQVTEPLRNYMKLHRIHGWRNLIIYTGSPLGAPAHFTRSSNINSTFRNFARTSALVLGPLANYVTISRIRATRGVLVFLDTMDITQMAKELGNTTETSLRHYLPDSLWDYFATRWVRIFQNLLIVEATRDTPYMQRALHFRSAAELDEFLTNHAFTSLIPTEAHLSEHGVPNTERGPSEVMVAASPGLFAILLSVAEATSQAAALGRPLTAQAVYWTQFTMRIKAHVESDTFHDRSIKQMLAAAAAHTKPSQFKELVCA